MKKIYNTIENNLKKGLNVVVKDLRDDTYCAISTNKDGCGDYKDSGWQNSIEVAKQFICLCAGYDKDYWNDKDLEIVEVFRTEYEPFKVGDKVRILDSIKKTVDWKHVEEYFPNMTGEIKEVFFDKIGAYYLVNDCGIGHEFLASLNEEQEEDVALEAIKLLEEKGYKIVKK